MLLRQCLRALRKGLRSDEPDVRQPPELLVSREEPDAETFRDHVPEAVGVGEPFPLVLEAELHRRRDVFKRGVGDDRGEPFEDRLGAFSAVLAQDSMVDLEKIRVRGDAAVLC